MGRKRKFLKGTEMRKEQDRARKYSRMEFKRVRNTFDQRTTKKLHQEGIYANFVLQDICKKEPERLLKISGFGPIKVKELCNKVGVQLKVDDLIRIYRNVEK
jgi:hypothetical protein